MPENRDISFGALKIFAAVAECETLTQAAQRLGITQSAVSQAVAQLESVTATRLVVRRSKPVKLTASGEVLNSHAQQILADVRRMLASVQRASDSGLPNLRIGFIDSFGEVAGQRLMERVGPFAIRLSLLTGFNAPLSDALISRDLDILITSDPLQDYPQLERHPILRDPFVLLAPEKYCAGGIPSLEKLANEAPFVRYTRQSRIGNLTDLITRRLNIQPIARYELDSTQTLLRFVQAGQGWAIATGLCLVQYPHLLEGVRIMKLGNGANARHISLVARHEEFGELPEMIAAMCREIYTDEILPRTLKLVPWLQGEATAITEAPII